MKIIILAGKTITLAFWGFVLVSLFSVFSQSVTQMLGWVGVAVLLVHFAEVAMFTKRFGSRLTEPKFDKLMVLIFGIFHIMPFLLDEIKTEGQQG
ncbi:DUF1145 domain-containing protein [Alkalimarinus sediminis]|uniref:DUF1145 domain-containing protein n=1 Tax=Alkalimarinus sediminis TaxID=1632866 RepID=A0A9E8HNC7_9ALTE|nr:DUF1145 domain-containing protein [Alkalimarinus sediminis]UZW73466.1 DUF1145 domain-containing protein [Alkalimarinus sediminis]